MASQEEFLSDKELQRIMNTIDNPQPRDLRWYGIAELTRALYPEALRKDLGSETDKRYKKVQVTPEIVKTLERCVVVPCPQYVRKQRKELDTLEQLRKEPGN